MYKVLPEPNFIGAKDTLDYVRKYIKNVCIHTYNKQ